MPSLAGIQGIDSLSEDLETAIDEKVVEALQKASIGFFAEFIPPFQKEGHNFAVLSNNSLLVIQEYAGQVSQKLGAINACQESGNSGIVKDEADIIQLSIENNDFTQMKCLSQSYKDAYESLMEVSVPSEWLDFHKEFLTIFWTLHKMHYHVADLESDPLKSAIALQRFEIATGKLVTLLDRIQTDLNMRQ